MALNLYFLPSASYYHKDFALRQPFSRAERDRYMTESAPIRKVVAYFNQAHPKEGVLLTHEGAQRRSSTATSTRITGTRSPLS